MLELEQETFDPSGISAINPPKMILNGVLISKSCGILYHVHESSGIRYVVRMSSHCSIPDYKLVRGATPVTSSPVRYRRSRHGEFTPETRS